MKTILTKVTYMAIGSLLTLIGYHFGNIDNNSANAQITITPQETEIVDEIRCRKIVIVGSDGSSRITLGTDKSDHGEIYIYNEDRKERVFLGSYNDYDDGVIAVWGKESGGIAATLSADLYGGNLTLYNKVNNKPILQAGITAKGDGFVYTRDKVGNKTGGIGPQESYIHREHSRN